ncbi:endolytic transglycosylase MltG [Cryobacterium sp. TMS1-20-1]|uniref:endolytic transglycosylase MltG n=1 Tax=Cryobacterium sp. TMS1-20-1 TaxID=1259223 RepID=UPI00106DA494|nr:endolytic transglycosylase MltG [Cryobacterium sp. TMS1-20-1]TFC82006.1 endolytic transglycosylase MltG [Cryobacterium sp. TMS1-20-1]
MPSTPEEPLPSRRQLRAQQAAAEQSAAEQGATERTGAGQSGAGQSGAEPAAASGGTASVQPPLLPRQAAESAEPGDDAAAFLTASNVGGSGRGRTNRRSLLADEPPREKRSYKGAWGCLIVFVVLAALVAGVALFLQGPISQIIAATQGPADFTAEEAATGEDVIVMIHDGNGGSEIAATLVEEGVVKSFDAFYSILLQTAPEPVFQPGAYQLKTKMVASTALDALLDEDTRLNQTVIVPEGTAAVDVLASISEGTDIPLADLQAAAANVAQFGLPAEATTLEGFLFPATYTFSPEATAAVALQTMVNRQYEALDAAGVAVADRWSTIVFASLIQREAGLRDDYYKVSRVFLNRLDPAQWDSGLLQSDASVAYGTGKTHLVTTTDAERADAGNPYNTYAHPGMVVGPISNPGDLAIDAALHPVDGSWLFFVTINLDSGETAFSTTVKEHDAAVIVWQNWMREHPEYG